MGVVVVYSRIYGTCLVNALAAIAKNAWTLLLPMALAVGMSLLITLVGGMNVVGGFLLALARTFAAGIYVYFLGELVAKNRVGLADLRKSIGAYFWSAMNLFFVLWIVDLVVGMVTANNPQGPTLITVLSLMKLVVLNAAPEVISQKGTRGGLDTIQTSFRFLQESWIEWFIPNALLLVLGWLFLEQWVVRVGGSPLATLSLMALGGAVLHVAMVFRGFLFQVLAGTSHRQRMFKFRRQA